MAWEWLAPLGTVIGAGITAGAGGWFGGRYARGTQQRQHDFDRRKAVDERGREKADEAITALRYLQRHRGEVVAWSTASPTGELDRGHEELDRLGQALEYLTNEAVREQVGLVHDVIADSFVINQFGEQDLPSTEVLIWGACREGVAVLGCYLRDQPPQAPTEYMIMLRRAHDTAHAEMERQYAEWLRTNEESD